MALNTAGSSFVALRLPHSVFFDRAERSSIFNGLSLRLYAFGNPKEGRKKREKKYAWGMEKTSS